jgi:hypothetical protein
MRVAKVRRFLDVQRQLQRAAERELHDLRREQQQLQIAQEEVLVALSREDELTRRMAPALTRRLARLAADAETAASAGERQVAVVLQQAGRLKHAERLEHVLGCAEKRKQNEHDLADVLDVVLGSPPTMVR